MRLRQPLVIIGAPRSGTTILFRCLAQHPDIWHLRAESHYILEGPLHPEVSNHCSNRCTADDATSDLLEYLRHKFYDEAFNINQLISNPSWLFRGGSIAGRAFRAAILKSLGTVSRSTKPHTIRFLEKTPKNSLRVSFLNCLFPDVRFVWNRRHPVDNIDSLIAGWHASDSFGPFQISRYARSGYPIVDDLNLRDYSGTRWKFALVPEWKSLQSASIGEVAALQYYQCNSYTRSDLEGVDGDRVFKVNHEHFVDRPLDFVKEILEWAGFSPSPVVERFARRLPKVNSTGRNDSNRNGRLRYPSAIRKGFARYPELLELAESMGYDKKSIKFKL